MPARILVVDDEPALCRLVARMLEAEGYVVVQACNGLVGLEVFSAAESFDLVVTDSQMPGMSGLEFVHRLREYNPGLPIIHLTGSHRSSVNDLPSDVRRLFKPFDLPKLLTAVQDLLAA